MAGPTSSSAADVVQNKLNVLLAKQERLLATWLPPRDPSTSDARTRAEIERDEDAIFTPTPATLGVGATPAGDSTSKTVELTSKEKLRKKLLGRRASSLPTANTRVGLDPRRRASMVPREGMTSAPDSDEDEAEVSRSSVGRAKNRKRHLQASQEGPADTLEATKTRIIGNSGPRPREAAASSNTFLDQILAQKSDPRKKKKHRHRRVKNDDVG